MTFRQAPRAEHDPRVPLRVGQMGELPGGTASQRRDPRGSSQIADVDPESTRPPVARRSRFPLQVALQSRTRSPPALTGLENESGAGQRGKDHEDSEGLSLENASHPDQDQRRPAPMVRAIDARSANAQVRRTRLPFTIDSF